MRLPWSHAYFTMLNMIYVVVVVAGLSSRGALWGDACARMGMCDLP